MMVEKFVGNKIFRIRFQPFLWVVAVVSICLNCYLIFSKVAETYRDSIAYTDEAPLEAPSVEAKAAAEPVKVEWVQAGDGVLSIDVNKPATLPSLFAVAGLDEATGAKLLDSIKTSEQLSDIKAGTRIQIAEAPNSKEAGAKKVTIYLDAHKVETTFNTALNKYETKRMALPLEWQVRLVSGQVNGSLFTSARKAGAEPSVISQLINLFSHDIDFQREIHTGDSFRVMYEYQTDCRGKIVKNPKILYANINLRGTDKELYRHSVASNSMEYYDKKGNSIKRSLLATPINGARITSQFGVREHPVLGFSRMHQGLDYGAPKGTPILAAGDGVVRFVKNINRGYGKHIQIKHNNSFETLYAHLSRFGSNIVAGAKVKQGQVIGYVGATGLATGPHLHYEVIKNGKKVNPKSQAPKLAPLKGGELAKFRDNIRKLEQMVAELDDRKVNTVALNIVKKK